MGYFTVYDIAVAQGIALAKNEWEAQLREQLTKEIEAQKKWCDCELIYGHIHAFGCNREFAKNLAINLVKGKE